MSGTAQLCVQGTWRWTQEGFAMSLKSSSWNPVFFSWIAAIVKGDVIQVFLQMIQTRERESHEVQRNIRGKRCNFQTARGLISHPVEICLPIFRVIQQFLYMFGEEHPACWWTIAAGGDLCFDLCLLYIYILQSFPTVFFWPADPEMITRRRSDNMVP